MKTLAVMAVLCTLIAGAAAQSSYSNPYNADIANSLRTMTVQNQMAQPSNPAYDQLMNQIRQQQMMQQMQQQQMIQQQMQQQTWNPYQYSTPVVPQISTVPVYRPAPIPQY